MGGRKRCCLLPRASVNWDTRARDICKKGSSKKYLILQMQGLITCNDGRRILSSKELQCVSPY